MKKSSSNKLLSRLALPTLLVGGIAIATGGYVAGMLNASLTPQVSFPTFWQVSSNSSAATAMPNLLPTAITAVPYQASPISGVQIRLQIQSTNNGTAAAAATTLTFGATKPDGTSVSYTQPLQQLAAGATVTNQFIVPGVVTYGKDYTISVCLDLPKNVAESNENDNCATAKVQLAQPTATPPTGSSSSSTPVAVPPPPPSSSSNPTLPTTCPLPLNCYTMVVDSGKMKFLGCVAVQVQGLSCEMNNLFSTQAGCDAAMTAAMQKACNVTVSLNGHPLTCTAPTAQ